MGVVARRPNEVVTIDPLFDDGPDAMVGLCERFGRYLTYADHEKLDSEIGRGLTQRHDSVLNFLRTGGLRGGTEEEIGVLAARTTYFREEYAYGDERFIDGIDPFLEHPRLIAGARSVHGREVVCPVIAYANLMVPGQELAVHTDVPEFRGANRKNLPQWLLVVMHHSGLFDDWRLHIATGISWFHDSEHGALAYWPDGPSGEPEHHRITANTAMVLDTDTVFHGVDRVTERRRVRRAPRRARIDRSSSSATVVGRSAIRTATTIATYDWDELRFSVSWKAYCFADDDERAAWLDHTDDLSEEAIVDRLVADLVERGLVLPDVERGPALGLLLMETYIEFP